MPFDGLRVLSFESRRAAEMEQLIRKQGGEPVVVPAVREVPVESSEEVREFARRLFRGEFDMMILLTGVGTRLLNRALVPEFGVEAFADALRRITVVARGPKPAAVLREMNVTPAVIAREPNTWREVLAGIEGRPERRIGVQEYGRSNDELLEALRARGAEVTPVRVYQWDLPEDAGPLSEAARRLAARDFDVVMFTTGVQVDHLFRIARDQGIEERVAEALQGRLVASIGPTTTEALEEFGIRPDLEPSHPKMGLLVQETAARAAEVLAGKRR